MQFNRKIKPQKSNEYLYVYSHLGLGDMIIANGALRYYATLYNKVYTFCKPINEKNIRKMYRDNDNIHIIVANDTQAKDFLKRIHPDDIKILGYLPGIKIKWFGHTNKYFNGLKEGHHFDDLFYTINNLDINIKWDSFYYERDEESELQAYKDYNLKENEEYIIVHQNNDRRVYKNIRTDLRIIEPNNMNIMLFDHLLLIEKAKEVHLMNSSLLNLINCSKIRTDGLYYHRYARPNIDPHLTNNWIIYE